jgi:hypothetical protein
METLSVYLFIMMDMSTYIYNMCTPKGSFGISPLNLRVSQQAVAKGTSSYGPQRP